MNATQCLRYEVRRLVTAFIVRQTKGGDKLPQPKTDERGFTILELIVAVTLVALMAVALFSAFRISLTSWSRGTAIIDASQRHRTILDLVKKQMTSIYAVMSPIDLQTGGAVYPIFSGSPDSLQFVSVTPLRFQDNPGLTVASYEVVRDNQGVYSLVESEEPFLGLAPPAITDRIEKPVVIPIFENLTTFTFEYLEPAIAERPSQWVKEWNTREMLRLPLAISMTMIATDARGQTFSRHLVVPIQAKPFDPRLRFVNPLEARPRS
jgi:general secretion pathway protein J